MLVWRKTKSMSNFGIFILLYNRTDNIPTLDVLHKHNCFDNIYLVVGKDDPQYDFCVNHYDNVLVFDKDDFKDEVDSFGSYKQTLKVCTYARCFVDKYAKENGIKYVCLLFDDINSMRIRYIDGNKVRSCDSFDLNKVILAYIDLLNSSDSVYMTGPPVSSFYIGCSPDLQYRTGTHNGNMLIYDTTKKLEPYKANVMEDVCIVLYNYMRGHIALFPFGFQVNVREIRSTADAYKNITEFEFWQQRKIASYETFDVSSTNVPYKKFMPKIVSSSYRKEL